MKIKDCIAGKTSWSWTGLGSFLCSSGDVICFTVLILYRSSDQSLKTMLIGMVMKGGRERSSKPEEMEMARQRLDQLDRSREEGEPTVDRPDCQNCKALDLSTIPRPISWIPLSFRRGQDRSAVSPLLPPSPD